MSVDTKQLFEAKQRLNAFLKEHPELLVFQRAIEVRLAKAGSPHNRMIVLSQMMRDNLELLKAAWKDLHESTR